MHLIAPLIKDMAIMLGVASLVVVLFQKIRQPVLLGYLLSGIIIGPYTPPYILVKDTASLNTLSELGVIFLMFCLGLEFSFHKLKQIGSSTIIIGLFETTFMLGVGFTTAWILNWPFYDRIFLAASLAISSTTIIIKALEDLGLKKRRFAELILGRLVIEDLLAILLLVGLSLGTNTGTNIYKGLATATIKLLIVVGGWFLIGYFLLPSLMRKITYIVNQETATIASVALCLLLACLAAYFDYSPALGAFIMGSILAETDLLATCEKIILPIRDVYAAIFFISVGMLIDPSVIISHWSSVLLLCTVTITGKIIANTIGSLLVGHDITIAARTGFGMAQIGEFSFIIIGLGVALQLTSPTLYPIIVAVSALTTFTTPYLLKVSSVVSQKLDHCLPKRLQSMLRHYSTFIYHYWAPKRTPPSYNIYITRLLINAVVTAIIFTLIAGWLLPAIQLWLTQQLLAQGLSWLLALLLSAPFIWGMLFSFRASTTFKQAPVVFRAILLLGWSFTATVIITLSLIYFNSWLLILVILSLSAIPFKLFYQRLEKTYYWFEQHLRHNLRQPPAQSIEPKTSINTELVCIAVDDHHPFIHKTVAEITLNTSSNLSIIAIYRGPQVQWAPHHTETIRLYDRVLLLGQQNQINAL